MVAERVDDAWLHGPDPGCTIHWSVQWFLYLLGVMTGLCLPAGVGAAQCSARGMASYPVVLPVSSRLTPTHHYEVIARYPHDLEAFTQGLVFHQGELYESTGIRGRSSVRKLDLKSGRVLKSQRLDNDLFGEGLTVFEQQLVQLTWQSGQAFIYAPDDLQQTGSFTLNGEGWGSTSIDGRLVVSDGSAWLRFIAPDEDYRQVASVQVTDRGREVRGLNELEAVNGLIYANVYPGDCIAQIDPQSGRVTGWIDLNGLMPLSERTHRSAVANGIAYNSGSGELFVTGKYWPYIYQLEIHKAETLPDKRTTGPETGQRTTTKMTDGG